MKEILIVALVAGGYWLWDYSKKSEAAAEKREQVERSERDAAKAAKDVINDRVKLACREAMSRKLRAFGGDRKILDWHPGLQYDHTYSETSSGYKIQQTAAISGHKSTFNADCFTDKNYVLLDATYGWWVGAVLMPIP